MWKTIESAPKDGTVIILCGSFMRAGIPAVRTGYWGGKRPARWMDESLGTCPRQPSHWHPLPDLPDDLIY